MCSIVNEIVVVFVFQRVIVNHAPPISGISPRNLQDLIVSIDESASPSLFDERPDGDAADEERAETSKCQEFLVTLQLGGKRSIQARGSSKVRDIQSRQSVSGSQENGQN